MVSSLRLSFLFFLSSSTCLLSSSFCFWTSPDSVSAVLSSLPRHGIRDFSPLPISIDPLDTSKNSIVNSELPFSTLPFCHPSNSSDPLPLLLPAPLPSVFLSPTDCSLICRAATALTSSQLSDFQRLISSGYRLQFHVDDLPAADELTIIQSFRRKLRAQLSLYEKGFPIGYKGRPSVPEEDENKYYLYNHWAFTIRYIVSPVSAAAREEQKLSLVEEIQLFGWKNNEAIDDHGDPVGFASQIQPASDYSLDRIISYNELSLHNSVENECWIAIEQTVYNVNTLIPFHKGGQARLLHFCGKVRDARKFYMVHAVQLLARYDHLIVGQLDVHSPMTEDMEKLIVGVEVEARSVRHNSSDSSFVTFDENNQADAHGLIPTCDFTREQLPQVLDVGARPVWSYQVEFVQELDRTYEEREQYIRDGLNPRIPTWLKDKLNVRSREEDEMQVVVPNEPTGPAGVFGARGRIAKKRLGRGKQDL